MKAIEARELVAKKVFRLNPGMGMGRYRYFLAPAGLIDVSELPPLWGLLEWDGRWIHVKQSAEWQDQHAVYHEARMLQSALRRLPPGTEAIRARYFQHKLSVGTEIHVLEEAPSENQ